MPSTLLLWQHLYKCICHSTCLEMLRWIVHYVIEHQARYLVIISKKKGVLLCKMYIRSGMFSFGLTNFLSLSDRMSDMLKKFSTSLYVSLCFAGDTKSRGYHTPPVSDIHQSCIEPKNEMHRYCDILSNLAVQFIAEYNVIWFGLWPKAFANKGGCTRSS